MAIFPPIITTPAGYAPVLYIAGPMTGLPELNFPAFDRAARHLRAWGYRIVNPVELNTDPGPTDITTPAYAERWRQCMRVDIRALVDCDGVALLPGWERSRGAQLEHQVATALGLNVRELAQWLDAEERAA